MILSCGWDISSHVSWHLDLPQVSSSLPSLINVWRFTFRYCAQLKWRPSGATTTFAINHRDKIANRRRRFPMFGCLHWHLYFYLQTFVASCSMFSCTSAHNTLNVSNICYIISSSTTCLTPFHWTVNHIEGSNAFEFCRSYTWPMITLSSLDKFECQIESTRS